jgi:uncharacterized GH25 family protein/ketosteroid isomerase-like protein
MAQRRPPRLLVRILAAGLLLVSAATLFAHDFWLVPDAFRIAPGGWLEVRGQTSSRFPTSEAAVALDRVAEARLLAAEGEERIRELSHSGTSLLLRHRPATVGQRIVAVALRPRSVRESAEGFREYLRLEGAPEALERYEREGRLAGRDSVTRRYAKYAKTVVEVGTGGPRAFARTAGHPLEFVPLSDPAALRAGERAAFRLLYRGRPMAGARIHAGAAPATTRMDAAADEHLETDADGVVRVCVDRPGLWNARTLQIVPSDPGSGADFDAHWATLVFEVPRRGTELAVRCAGPAGAAPPPGADSAEVAATVERYHRALASADSAGALALLTPDAVILESGGLESRAEYRSHHLPADIEFARAVRSERSEVRVRLRGDAAWAASTSTTQGEFRGRPINAAGAELMVLVRTSAGWRIAAIHWSSRARRS